jgi:hypothetical protein
MSDYSQGKIYIIYIPGLEEYGYVGSTVEELRERLYKHRALAKHPEKYQFASCVLFQDDNEVCIKLLEAYPCENKQQLLERERYWLNQYPEAVNKNPPILNEDERKARHKEIHLKAYNKNKEHNLEKHREWIEANKEQQAEYKKAKREANLEEARMKEREANARRDKTKRNEWKNKKVSCSECNLVLSRNNFPTHKKNKHPDMEVHYTEI